eukprot:CAMPEP_0113527884 /NCGR_PEP_ID=MMETSP0015_2-20120614/1540_1 /TAXON_ID=2838 /ORGANISM="Odontella" /LENGTH=53 /DNA_ID=CAMNT_0000426361 /DNA_START=404 /DNA_END=565 /DNA_ORIENTATION=- /assembly_acc=CAM_ASM_000160
MGRDREKGDEVGVMFSVVEAHIRVLSTVKMMITTKVHHLTTFEWEWPLDDGQS